MKGKIDGLRKQYTDELKDAQDKFSSLQQNLARCQQYIIETKGKLCALDELTKTFKNEE